MKLSGKRAAQVSAIARAIARGIAAEPGRITWSPDDLWQYDGPQPAVAAELLGEFTQDIQDRLGRGLEVHRGRSGVESFTVGERHAN